MAPKSIIHLFEEETRHVLPNFARALTGVDAFSASCYCEYLTDSSAVIVTILSEESENVAVSDVATLAV